MKAILFATLLAAAASPLASASTAAAVDGGEASFTSAVSSVAEGPTVVTVEVSLSAVPTVPVSIPYSRSGSAVIADATLPAGPLVIPAGSTSGLINVTIADDGDSEGRERVVLTLGSPTNAVLGATTVHELIIEDDEAPADISFDLASTAANEGDGVVPLTLTLSAARTEEARVSFTQTGTAIPGGVDVSTSPASPIIFAAGSTTATLDVILVQDSIDEPSETFALTLLAPINGTLGATAQHTVTIEDDDAAPSVSFGSPSSSLVESGAGTTVTVTLSSESAFDVTVPVSAAGTATAGSDYTWIPGGSGVTGDVMILAGETSGQVTVTPQQDSAVEGTETIALALGTPTNGTLGSGSTHQMLLIDDDGPAVQVGFVAAASMVAESGGSMNVDMLLSDYAPQTVEVPFTTSGTADLGADYSVASTMVTIPVGSLSGSATVTVVDDTEAEANETVILTLGTPVGADIGSPSIHTLTLEDDDGVPTVDFALATSSFSESAGLVTVSVQLSSPAVTPVDLTVSVAGTAGGAGDDFTLGANPVTIATGDTTGFFEVDLVGDSLFEGDETIELMLVSAVGADLGTEVLHTLNVTNDDAEPVVEFTTFRAVAAEIDGSFNLRFVLDGPSGLPVSVPFTASGDGAGPGDATIPPSPAVIPAGDTFVDLPVGLVIDRNPELAERILFEMGAPVDATLGSISTQLVLISDGDRGPFAVPAALSPSVSALQFPTIRAFESSAAQAVFFTNLNTVPLTVTDVQRVGTMKGDFVLNYPVPLPITLQPGTGFQVDVHFEPMGAGERSLQLRPDTVEVTGPTMAVQCSGLAYGATGEEIRMNAAEVGFDGPAREDYTSEYGVSGGSLGSSQAPVSGTSLDGLYQSFRFGSQFSYALELPNGAYDVLIRAWEPIQTQVGGRIMDVSIEGAIVLDDLDLVAAVGTGNAYTSAPLRVTVTDGVMDIDFAGVTGSALVSAIEVSSVPLITLATSSLSFGDVDQGSSGTLMVDFDNQGLHTGALDRLTFRVDTIGDARDFSVEVGGVVYQGSETTVVRSPNIELPPGVTSVPVTFTPTFHEDHLISLEFENSNTGEFFSLDATGTGGAQAGWGFLHPVPDQTPDFVVDYDGDGSEAVLLRGGESHTHEPGKSLATFEWEVGGVPVATTVDTMQVLPVGSTTSKLTIGDDNQPSATASDVRTVTVHPVDRVPGILALYYDGSTAGEVFLLDNVPARYSFASRLEGLQVVADAGKVGNSPFTEKVMVRWIAQFDTTAPRTLEFVATGGVDRRVFIDGVLATAPVALTAGTHDVEVRFAVSSLSDLPVELSVLDGGSVATDIQDAFVYNLSPIPPAIHTMPTTGVDLGGNRIDIDGFGFFPEAQTVVHWGAIDIPASQFDGWSGERITLTTPPGNGSIQVTVETPQGITDPVQFDYSPTGPIPVRFDLLESQAVSIANVTCAQWGPDGKLYVAVLDGTLRILTYDDNWNITSIQFKTGISGLINKDTLGFAFNPFDAYDPADPTSIKLYISHGEQYQNGGGAFSGPSYFTGQVSVLTGPGFNNPAPLITQLPVSNHDHSVNGPLFDDNGDLLLCVGGNTNGGVAADALGALPESPLSGAVLRAFTSRPGFNGTILYQDSATGVFVDDQVFGEQIDVAAGVDIEVYAPGFRNSLDMVLHTNGYYYTTDNGANAGFGPASLSMTTEGPMGSADGPDELNIVEPGVYYGAANRARGRYDAREAVYYDPWEASIAGAHRKPMRVLLSSTNGVDEYRATAFNSAMRGDVIACKWSTGLYRIILSNDGRQVSSATLYSDPNDTAFPQNKGLDVIAGPGGALIAIDYSGDKIRVQVPDDVSAIGPTPFDIFPWRVTAGGGQPFVIGGENFGTSAANVAVTIGGVPATVTSVSDTRIRGVFPPSPTGAATELLDVAISFSGSTKTITGAMRYLPPAPGMATGTWRAGSNLPLPLGEVAACTVGQKFYIFGQGDARTFVRDEFQGSWSLSAAQRPFAGNHHGLEVIGGKIYLMGGLDNGSAGRVQIYDTVNDVWTLGAPMPWNGGSCSTALIGGKIYVGGGNLQGSGTAGNFAVYDPALDTWTALGLMPTPVNHAASGSDGEKLYVFGGRQGQNVPQAGFDDVQIYDPVADTWTTSAAGQVAAMPLPRGGTGRAVFYRGEFYVMGGEDTTVAFDDVQIYNPATDTWRVEKPMTTARHGIYPVLFESRIFVLGGGLNAGFGFSNISEVLSPR